MKEFRVLSWSLLSAALTLPFSACVESTNQIQPIGQISSVADFCDFRISASLLTMP